MPSLTDLVKESLVDDILKGRFAVGDTLPAMEDLAKAAKCSVGTVNRALLELADDGVVQRIRKKGTVVARHPQRYLGRVCLLQSTDAHTNQLLVEPIFAELTRAHYTVDVVPASDDADLTVTRCETLRRQSDPARCLVSLFYLKGGAVHPDHRQELEAIHDSFPQRIRFCEFPNSEQTPGTHWITPDWMDMARQVMEHFLRNGHRRMAVAAALTPQLTSPVSEEAEFCRHLVEIAGGSVYPVYFGSEDYVQALPVLFRRKGITAYWAITDHEALRAVNELHRAGVDVPGAVSVVGRNDTPWCREVRPALSTVSWNPPAVARAIAGTLQDLRGEKQSRPGQTLVKPKLIVRESSGRVGK